MCALQVRQQQRKYGGRNRGGCPNGGGAGATGNFNSGSYGSSKKVLGTRYFRTICNAFSMVCSPRRGASSRFVPPVRRDCDGNSVGSSTSTEAELRSRVFKGRETGGGSNTNSKYVVVVVVKYVVVAFLPLE